ncbi:MAG: bifunctional phosphopantothenoylcysteine decarboxylase/phosphopantothenate--cysteine ligase CoaBC [Boseongicola sp. SB0662_bin_57]|nr:bifunctional phosphopantothenoylcysteine decarboxylase/phosphopantothenate--cysteine ligase CoaBC [Boseongicola sp. SB0662_bin_57]
MLDGKRVLLIVGGGIAAYKSLDLIRQVRKAGGAVTPVLTRAAMEFITPLSASALAGEKVYTDLFDLTDEAEMGHIELSRSADILVVAPATADLAAKMVGGHADDLASTLLMATDTPVLIAPAMNMRMWLHPANQRNMASLESDGVARVGPSEGEMACGEYGPGRMAEPDEIVDAIVARLGAGALSGRHVVVTSGPTHEPIDPVRYIANRSSGAQGSAIAAALAALGAKVTFVTGPAAMPPPQGVAVVRVETARQMLGAVKAALPADAAVFAAAVADWHVEMESGTKIKKRGASAGMNLSLAENPDILATVSRMRKDRPGLVVGFAAETDDVIGNARAKLRRKKCDWIVANDVSPATGIMGGDENAVTVIDRAGEEAWPRASKEHVARRLAQRIADAIS